MADFSSLFAAPASSNFHSATMQSQPQFQSNLIAATDMLKLNPQERALYQRHIDNLIGSGGVDNPPDAQNPGGSRSTLFQATVDNDGKTYAIPTVWDGKILSVPEAVQRVAAEGWDKFPSYATPDEAERRYQLMHSFMEGDTQRYLESRK